MNKYILWVNARNNKTIIHHQRIWQLEKYIIVRIPKRWQIIYKRLALITSWQPIFLHFSWALYISVFGMSTGIIRQEEESTRQWINEYSDLLVYNWVTLVITGKILCWKELSALIIVILIDQRPYSKPCSNVTNKEIPIIRRGLRIQKVIN